MVANTGTYIDAPFHRYAEGIDLSGLKFFAVPAPVKGMGSFPVRAFAMID
ncbi:MAG: hypothetical protein PVI00_17180 [Desulfobacterales bacterium]|jgi:kynurenine formamidase